MKKMCVLVVVLLLGSVVGATPIAAISATCLSGTFSPEGGDWGIGVFVVNDTANIEVEDGLGVQTNYSSIALEFAISLYADSSSNELADGSFKDGSLSIGSLLQATVLDMRLTELYDGVGILAGVGYLQVTGGSLAADFGSEGEIVQITFSVTPPSISDFTQSFTGESDVSLLPVPEPMTIVLMGIGGLVLRKQRKNS